MYICILFLILYIKFQVSKLFDITLLSFNLQVWKNNIEYVFDLND